jgi:two-component system, LuxR family, sensor kinase FixL
MDFSLLEYVPDAIVIADVEGRLVYANGTATDLFGWTREEMLALRVEDLLPARFRGGHLAQRVRYHEAPRTRPMGAGKELAGLRRDGSEFVAEIALAPLQAGGRTLAIAAVRDVTERKRTEEKALLYRQAREEVRARDEFLSIAAHELRTPVAALHLQLQLLQRFAARTEGGVAPAMASRLQALEAQARRLGQVVEDLLDLSRVRLGRLDLRPEELDLAELARGATAPFQADPAVARGSRIVVEAPAPVVGTFDRMRLEQVLGNLLGNAVKFGEGRPIEVRVERRGERAVLTVADHGTGVRPEDRERIFGRFERAAPAQHFGGLGLGLYVAHQIVEAHQGAISVEDTPGGGATFTVSLPCAP